MAGSGDLSRIGWLHALGTFGTMVASGVVAGPPGDLIGTLSTALTADTAYTSITCSAGTTKAIPNNAVLLLMSGGTDAANTWDICTLNNSGGYATGTTSAMTVQSFRPHVSHNTSTLVYLLSAPMYLALVTSASAPTSHALGTEYQTPGSNGYNRQPLTGMAATTVADPPVAALSGTITFGPITGGTGAIVSYGEVTDSIAGTITADNMYAYFTWGTPKTPGVNDSIQLAGASALSLQGS